MSLDIIESIKSTGGWSGRRMWLVVGAFVAVAHLSHLHAVNVNLSSQRCWKGSVSSDGHLIVKTIKLHSNFHMQIRSIQCIYFTEISA